MLRKSTISVMNKVLESLDPDRYHIHNLKDADRLRDSIKLLGNYTVEKDGTRVTLLYTESHKALALTKRKPYRNIKIDIDYLNDIYSDNLLLAILKTRIEEQINRLTVEKI